MNEKSTIVQQAFLVVGDFAFLRRSVEEKGYPYVLAVDCNNETYRAKLVLGATGITISTSSIGTEERRKEFAQILELNQEFILEVFDG